MLTCHKTALHPRRVNQRLWVCSHPCHAAIAAVADRKRKTVSEWDGWVAGWGTWQAVIEEAMCVASTEGDPRVDVL
jgi:hypothetical protein